MPRRFRQAWGQPRAMDDIALVIVATITPPAGVTLTASGAAFSLSWAAPPGPADLTGPLSYNVVLLAGTTKVGESNGVAGCPQPGPQR